MMKLLKYYIGSLIISFGILMLLAIIMRAIGLSLPKEVEQYLLFIWLGLAVVLMPLAKKLVRV